MPIPIIPIIALIEAVMKVAEIIKDSSDIDPEDKKKLIKKIRECQIKVKEWE